MNKVNEPLKVFITYSHQDKAAKETLITYLAVMVQQNKITIWHDNEILPGDSWREEISKKLQSSDILLYLVSATSLASKNCNKELAEALEVSSPKIIVPIIIEDCDWKQHELSDFQVLPEFGKAISRFKPKSNGWQNVVDGLRKRIDCKPPLDKHDKTLLDLDLLLNLANFLLGLQQTDQAIEIYSNIIDKNPQYAVAYCNRGVAKAKLGQYEKAITDYNEAIRFNPQDSKAYYNRGNARSKLKQYKKAIASYSEAIRLDPQYADAYCNRGIAKGKLEQYEKAITDYNKAIRFNPESAEAYYNLGNAEGKLGKNKEAIADYGEAIRINPESAKAYCNRGLTKGELGQYETAIADFDKAIRLYPQYANAYYNRGIAKAGLGQNKESIADLKYAFDLARKQDKQELVQDILSLLDKLR